MRRLRRRAAVSGMVLCGTLLWAEATDPAAAGAQATVTSPDAPQPSSTPGSPAPQPAGKPATPPPVAPPSPVQTGLDHPAIPVRANRDSATVRVVLRSVKPEPQASDFEVGPLSSTQQPGLLVRPVATLVGVTLVGKPTAVDGKPPAVDGADYQVDLKIGGLIAFGESSAPLLHKGRQVELLRFSRPGLVVKASGEGGFVAREGSPFALVLENPLDSHYPAVRARLRFADEDICVFKAEKFVPTVISSSNDTGSCDQYTNWTSFEIPQYAPVTVRADPLRSWFFDPATGFARSSKRKGWLSLRYSGDGNSIHEQTLPMEVQFEPGNRSLLGSLAWVFFLLAVGALLSLLLRVWVPNIKRKQQLRDKLGEAAELTASISTEVDSNLRVLLRVERLALDEIRRATWPLSPAYGTFAQRVEQGLPILTKRIEAVRRLDAALIRHRQLMEQGAAPTSLENIESLLSTVSESLKQGQLSDQDWVFVNQKLETAQKLLGEPTTTEKDAFEALLVGRWKAIRDHFGVDATTQRLKIPPVLKGMDACFPLAPLLPKKDDPDGSKWIQSVGPVRADLQISALMLLWEFEFLAPNDRARDDQEDKWDKAKEQLAEYLATPAVGNLRKARSMLRQLAERYDESDIRKALKKKDGFKIVMDPAIARPNLKIRFSVSFSNPDLNTAAARAEVSCRWKFEDRFLPRRTNTIWRWLWVWLWRWVVRWIWPWPGHAEPSGPRIVSLPETGWSVHHYFQSGIDQSQVKVSFFDSDGQPVFDEDDESEWRVRTEKPRRSGRSPEIWSRFRIELVQLGAALLVPMATLASSTISGATTAHPWELIAIGFGADTIKNILVSRSE